MTYNARVQQKLDTSAGWSASSITLLDGELALVRDNGKTRIKVGDGKTAYASLPFLDQDAVTHIANKENPHGVTKAQVGLGNVNNTADADKTVKAAGALTVVSKGSATKPVYFDASGVPVACTYSLNADVPSDAKFTDTVYTHPESHPASMITGLANIATTGNYDDLINTPITLSGYGITDAYTKTEVEALYKKLNTNRVLGFYCIEDVTIVTNGISTVHPANSNVEVKFIEDDVFEIIPTSNNSILTLTAFPGALGTFYPWLEGVKQFSNILFDMNSEDMYTKWNQGNQGVYQVQYAQYSNCIFWSDNPYITDVAKRTNYTLYYSAQIPLCYSHIPDNTFKSFYLAFNVNSDPNWGNKAYRDSFAKATWATQAFSYYGGRTIGIFDHDNSAFNIALPTDCRGLMYAATAVENAGVFDAINTTNFGASSGSWRDAFGDCKSLRNLYIKNLKVNLNVSWSPLNYDSIYFIISKAANTNNITITVSPYTYNLLSQADFELAASKNITIQLLTTNYVEDRRLSAVTITGDGSKVLSDDGTYKPLLTPATTLSGYGITDAYTKTEVDNKVAGLVDSAPEALNTLNELATALGEDPNFATTMSTEIGKKANSADLAKVATSGSYNDLSNKPTIPTSLPANGGNAATVGGFTVGTNVPAGAVFTDTVYTHPTYTAKSSGLYKITVNSLGHVSAATAVSKNDITGLGIPAQDTVYTHPNSGVTAGTYRSVTVNAQGHVTAGSNPTITVEQGGTGATSGDGARQKLAVNIKTYTKYSQLGLSETPADMPTLLAAIPNESNFIKQFSSSYEQFGLPFEGTLIIFKASYGEAMLWLTSAYSTNWRMAFGHATASGTVTWRDPSFLENGVLPITSGGTGANSAAGILTNLGITATAAELNYVDGVTSNIQTQLNGKLSTSGKAASATVADSANAVAWSNVSGKPTIPAVTKVTFTASDSKWGSLSNGRYPLTISASGGEFLNCYRTNGSNYDKMDVNVTVSGNNIIIYSLDKFAGYMTYLK